jgi:hypothetical protein
MTFETLLHLGKKESIDIFGGLTEICRAERHPLVKIYRLE